MTDRTFFFLIVIGSVDMCIDSKTPSNVPKQGMFLFLFPRAGKPPPGLHLDVVKGDKLIEV